MRIVPDRSKFRRQPVADINETGVGSLRFHGDHGIGTDTESPRPYPTPRRLIADYCSDVRLDKEPAVQIALARQAGTDWRRLT